MNSANLIREIINVGFKAVIVSVNGRLLDESFCGRTIDENFLKDLPANVDPCGENGEFHTFVYDGPNFKFPVDFKLSETTKKIFTTGNKNAGSTSKKETWDSAFWYCDLTAV